jgi:hypothetical protein
MGTSFVALDEQRCRPRLSATHAPQRPLTWKLSATCLDQNAYDFNLMNAAAWSEAVAALHSRDVDTCVAAAERLHKDSTPEDVPALLELLKTGDFFEREAAAWPLAEISGASHLGELLSAYQQSFEEGHDNDGFTAALLEIPALFPAEARSELTKLASVVKGPVRAHCLWLLDFCETA